MAHHDSEKAKGYVSIDRATIQKLCAERPTVRSLFYTLISKAITHRIHFYHARYDGSGKHRELQIWEAGSRCWSLRQLAEVSNMSQSSVRRGLKRLTKTGMIVVLASSLGTAIRIVDFHNYMKKNPNLERRDDFMPRVNKPSSQKDTHRSSLTILQKTLPNFVAVPRVPKQVGTVIINGESIPVFENG